MAVTKKGPQRGREGCVSTLPSVVKTADKPHEALTQLMFPIGVAEALQKRWQKEEAEQPARTRQWMGPQPVLFWFILEQTDRRAPERRLPPVPKNISFGHQVHKAISASGYANPTVTRIWMLSNGKGFLK